MPARPVKTRYGLEIRAASSAEAPGLADLFAASGQAIDHRALAERLDAIHRGPGAALVALEWGPPSGVIVLHWFSTLAAPHPTAQITMLLVGAGERRRGIGRLLIKAAAQAARVAGCGALELACAADAPDLHAFCKATGFAEGGVRFTRALRKKGAVEMAS